MAASGTKVYVGGLRPDMTEREVEDEFRKFGKIFKIWVARKPPGFAFIDYEDYRDAEDAVRKLDGHNGWRVEISRSKGPGNRPAGREGGRSDACFNCGEPGHIARDCRKPSNRDRGGGGGGGRRDYSPRRGSPIRARSRSPITRRSPSPRRGRSRDRSPPPRSRSR